VQKYIQSTPPFAQLEQRVDDSFPQTTHSPKAEGGAGELEEDMLRVGRVTGVETQPIAREVEKVRRRREREERERERESSKKVRNSRTAESPVDPYDDDGLTKTLISSKLSAREKGRKGQNLVVLLFRWLRLVLILVSSRFPSQWTATGQAVVTCVCES